MIHYLKKVRVTCLLVIFSVYQELIIPLSTSVTSLSTLFFFFFKESLIPLHLSNLSDNP